MPERHRPQSRRSRTGRRRPARRSRLIWAVPVLGGVAAAAAAFFLMNASSGGPTGSKVPLPDFVRSRPAAVREAYAYGVEHPEVLAYIPCYCGCDQLGHTDNDNCFVDERLSDGTVVFERHGST